MPSSALPRHPFSSARTDRRVVLDAYSRWLTTTGVNHHLNLTTNRVLFSDSMAPSVGRSATRLSEPAGLPPGWKHLCLTCLNLQVVRAPHGWVFMDESETSVGVLEVFATLGDLVEALLGQAEQPGGGAAGGYPAFAASLLVSANTLLDRCYPEGDEREAHRALFALSQQVVIPARAYSPDPFVSVQIA